MVEAVIGAVHQNNGLSQQLQNSTDLNGAKPSATSIDRFEGIALSDSKRVSGSWASLSTDRGPASSLSEQFSTMLQQHIKDYKRNMTLEGVNKQSIDRLGYSLFSQKPNDGVVNNQTSGLSNKVGNDTEIEAINGSSMTSVATSGRQDLLDVQQTNDQKKNAAFSTSTEGKVGSEDRLKNFSDSVMASMENMDAITDRKLKADSFNMEMNMKMIESRIFQGMLTSSIGSLTRAFNRLLSMA